ncbi:MAG: cytochrome c-type biogenesis protein CcmH [Acidimicrobiales bacterium]|nr:cytochrome c-type biogenesis protein CcmH [Acidimicrobiales bacterium]
MNRQRVAWLVVIAAVVIALVVALGADPGGKATAAEQADDIANGVRCPTCAGQSVAESAAPAAQAIKTEIRRRVDAGETRQEIEAFLEGRYGEDILLTPPRSGIGGLVWIIPVVAVVGAAAGLGVALQRWSRRSLASATDDDRAIVAAAEQR